MSYNAAYQKRLVAVAALFESALYTQKPYKKCDTKSNDSRRYEYQTRCSKILVFEHLV
jgi:hypothetical protein